MSRPDIKGLVMGWFSFERYGATAGDLMAKDVVVGWLKKAAVHCDVALAPPFQGGVDWRHVAPSHYTHLIFVCGPFGEHEVTQEFLERFSHCRKIGINLSMLQSLDEWNPFDLLLERDSSRACHPDISFLAAQPKVPVVGLILIEQQNEYKARGRHREASAALRRLITANELAVVEIDTRLDENGTGLRSPNEIESLIARMDMVLTTRLHGLVLALKNGVPALTLDAISGGAKVSRQAESIGWTACYSIDTVTDEELQSAFKFCLSEAGRTAAEDCAARAIEKLDSVARTFDSQFKRIPSDSVPSGTTPSIDVSSEENRNQSTGDR